MLKIQIINQINKINKKHCISLNIKNSIVDHKKLQVYQKKKKPFIEAAEVTIIMYYSP